MISFIVSLVALILGYLLYGRFVERVVAPDDRVTPAVAKADDVRLTVVLFLGLRLYVWWRCAGWFHRYA